MNVLLIIDGMHPRDGGPPVVVADSACGLRGRGHEVTILTTLVPGDEEDVRRTWQRAIDAGVRFVFCPPQGPGTLVGLRRPDALLGAEIGSADIVHIHSFWSPISLLAARIASRLRTPYVISTHGVLDHRALRRLPAKWLKKRLAIELFDMRGFLEGAAAVVFGSEAEAEQSWLPTRKVGLVFVPNGADRDLGTIQPRDD